MVLVTEGIKYENIFLKREGKKWIVLKLVISKLVKKRQTSPVWCGSVD